MRDELLSSWMGRLAKANHCSVEELCGYLGLGQGRVPECASDLQMANWAMLCGAVQRSPDEIVSMALPDTMHHDVQYVSRHDFQFCPACVAKSPDLVLRHWRLAWSMTCEICGQVLAAKYPAKDVSGRLHARALRGAEVLKTAAATTDLARLRRISLTLQVMSVLKIGRLWSLTSGNKRERLLALAAVGIGTTRPLLGAAIRLAATRRTEEDMARIRRAYRSMDARNAEGSTGMEEDYSFHLAVARASGNRFYVAALEQVRSHIEQGMTINRTLSLESAGPRLGLVQTEHARIIDALELGVSGDASDAMETHLKGAMARLFEG